MQKRNKKKGEKKKRRKRQTRRTSRFSKKKESRGLFRIMIILFLVGAGFTLWYFRGMFSSLKSHSTEDKKKTPMNDFLERLKKLSSNPKEEEGLVKMFEIEKGSKVVDHGVGHSSIFVGVSREVGENGEVVAFDINPAMGKFVSATMEKHGVTNTKFVSSDSDLETSGYDVVYSVRVLYMVELGIGYALGKEKTQPDDIAGYFAKIHRILKPDGFLFLVPGGMQDVESKIESTGLFKIVKSAKVGRHPVFKLQPLNKKAN